MTIELKPLRNQSLNRRRLRSNHVYITNIKWKSRVPLTTSFQLNGTEKIRIKTHTRCQSCAPALTDAGLQYKDRKTAGKSKV